MSENSDKYFYRYEDGLVRMTYQGGGRPLYFFGEKMQTVDAPTLKIFKVIGVTEKRYKLLGEGIGYSPTDAFWIKKSAKRPKYRENKRDALNDYFLRKKKQCEILQEKLDIAQRRMANAEELLDEKN
jgi:hypothetical protein